MINYKERSFQLIKGDLLMFYRDNIFSSSDIKPKLVELLTNCYKFDGKRAIEFVDRFLENIDSIKHELKDLVVFI